MVYQEDTSEKGVSSRPTLFTLEEAKPLPNFLSSSCSFVGVAWFATHTPLAPPLLPPLKDDARTASLREFHRLFNGSELPALCLVSVGE